MITIDSSLCDALDKCCFAWTLIQDARCAGLNDQWPAAWNRETAIIKDLYSLDNLTLDPGIRESRRIFKALGVDPSRYRPSQEALIRRFFKNQDMYRVNAAVDLNNLLSVRFRVPMGLYDYAKIQGPLVIRRGRSAESYMAHNDRAISCEDKLVISDASGAFGSPYVDSRRTAVDDHTRQLLHVVFCCYDSLNNESFESMRTDFERYLGGDVRPYASLRWPADAMEAGL